MSHVTFYRVLGERIRGQRKQRGWSQQRLANRVGISRASVANIETGRQKVLVHQLCAFAEALDKDTAELLPPARSEIADVPLPKKDLSDEQREQVRMLMGSMATASSSRTEGENN